MKKLTLFLAAALLAASFAACGNSGASSSTAPEPTAIPDDILNAPATKPDPDMEIDPGFGVDPEDSSAALQPEPDAELSDIVDQIYAAHPVDLMMVETTAVDLTNAEWYPYQTGLNEEQITKVDAAVTSEPGVGSQAYCMAVSYTHLGICFRGGTAPHRGSTQYASLFPAGAGRNPHR